MFTVLAPAKINWTLNVLDERPDGYHNIQSLMHCISLYDELGFDLSGNIEVISNMNLPPEQNLVYKTAVMLREYSGTDKGAKIILRKSVPSGAGLGGGSSDAAYALIGLNRLWKLGYDNSELENIGRNIGSDVPFFFHCPIGLIEGKGEIITPLDIDATYTLLLVKPPASISTSWAYKTLKKERVRVFENGGVQSSAELTKNGFKRDNIKLIYEALVQRDFALLRNLISNDLESIATAHFSIIGKLKKELLDSGAYIAMMTGSGSAVFGLFENRREAVIASRNFTSFWHAIVNTLKKT